jgi:tripartite-type tricarboxylate transporter receptor subunit TctC
VNQRIKGLSLSFFQRADGQGRKSLDPSLENQQTCPMIIPKTVRAISVGASLVFAAGLFSSCSRVETDYSWQPRRTVTIIVPWAAGGATDQVTRVVAGELGQALGQRVVVVNQPGASGAIGTKTALEADPDGLTWTAGAASSIGTYPVLGLLETSLADWHLFFAVANVPVVSVNPEAPFQDFGELLEAFQENPGKISVATAGIASSGHNLMESIKKASGLEYRHVTYDGGGPAVTATVAGETMVTTQLATEQAEMIRAKRLRPLAVLSDEPFDLEGHGSIPPITQWLPDVTIAPEYFGIWVRKGVPAEVVETVRNIWAERISQSEPLKKYARQRGALFTPYYGEEAEQRAMPIVRANAWILHDIGQAAVSPEELGIPRP